MPVPWDKLFKFIKAAKLLDHHPLETGHKVTLLNPLILGGWGASEKDKSERFIYHLREADALSVLPQVISYLNQLTPNDFLMAEGKLSDTTSLPT